MAYVKTGQSLRNFPQLEAVGQRPELPGDHHTGPFSHRRRVGRIGQHHLHPRRAVAADPVLDLHPASCPACEQLRQGVGIAYRMTGQDFVGRVAPTVVLEQESPHDLPRSRAGRRSGIKAPRSQQAPTAERHDCHAIHPAVAHQPNGIEVTARPGNQLLRFHRLEFGDLVTVVGRALEIQLLRSVFHAFHQYLGDRLAAPLQEHHGVLDIAPIVLRTHQSHARCGTSPDLVLQAGALTVGEIAVFALADLEELLQLAEGLADRAGAGIRTEQRPAALREPR